MHDYRHTFLQLAVDAGALKFGRFTLKSGRVSPYFFNAGAFCSGTQLACLANCYAAAIQAAKIKYDVLFGPAYKGIPLVSATACALANQHQIDVPFTYNRKQAKDHGEGGMMVGSPLHGRVLIVDDVISAGTASAESVHIIRESGARPVALAIALDRQERGDDDCSAARSVSRAHAIQVISVATLRDLQDYMGQHPSLHTDAREIAAYRARYGA